MKIFLTLALANLLIIKSSIANGILRDSTFTVKGRLSGLPDGTNIYLIKLSKSNVSPVDTIETVKSRNEEFIISGEWKAKGELAFIKIDTSEIKFSKRTDITLFVDTALISITGIITDWPNVKIVGSKTTEGYLKMTDSIIKILDTTSASQPLSKQLETRNRNADNCYKILLAYPDNYATPIVIKNCAVLFSSNQLDQLYTNLTKDVKESNNGILLRKIIRHIKAAESIREGMTIPSFEVADINGKSINILEFAKKNKYTLIDFWASWCKPCRDAFPEIKIVYEKYKSHGFNVVSISTDKNQEAWKKALEKEQLPWLQTIESIVAVSREYFGIGSIPSYILIDSNGKLISFDSSSTQLENFGQKLSGSNLSPTISNLFNHTDNINPID